MWTTLKKNSDEIQQNMTTLHAAMFCSAVNYIMFFLLVLILIHLALAYETTPDVAMLNIVELESVVCVFYKRCTLLYSSHKFKWHHSNGRCLDEVENE